MTKGKKSLVTYMVTVGGSIFATAIWTFFTNQKKWHAIIVFVITGIIIFSSQIIFEKLIKRLSCGTYPEIICKYASQKESNEDMINLLKKASNLDILTIRGLGIIGLNDSALRKTLFSTEGRSINIRILMLDPKSTYIYERAEEIKETADTFKQALELGIERVKELQNTCTHNISIYTYDQKPCWRIIRIDDYVFVSVFDRQIEGHRSNVYKIDISKKGTLGRALSRYIDALVESSAVVKEADYVRLS